MTPTARRFSALGAVSADRWVLILLVSLPLIAAALVSVAPNPAESVGRQSAHKVVAESLSADPSSLSLFHLDAMLERVSIDGAGNLVLDTQTAAALESAVADLPGTVQPAIEARARFLVHKGLPGPAGERLADLMMRYHRYHMAQHNLGLSGGAITDRDAYGALVRLQVEHFGEADAQRLFSQQNALTRALLETAE